MWMKYTVSLTVCSSFLSNVNILFRIPGYRPSFTTDYDVLLYFYFIIQVVLEVQKESTTIIHK